MFSETERKRGEGWQAESATEREVKTGARAASKNSDGGAAEGPTAAGRRPHHFLLYVWVSRCTGMFATGRRDRWFQRWKYRNTVRVCPRPYISTGRLSASAGYKLFISRAFRMKFCFQNHVQILGAQHYYYYYYFIFFFWLWVVNSFLLHEFVTISILCHLLILTGRIFSVSLLERIVVTSS